jgi:hypothetical protein
MIKNFGNVLKVDLELDKGEQRNLLKDLMGLENASPEDFEGISRLLPGLSIQEISEIVRELGRQGNVSSWRSIELQSSERLDLPLLRQANFKDEVYKPGEPDAPILSVKEGDYTVLSTLDFSPDGSNLGALWEGMMTLKAVLGANNLQTQNPAQEALFSQMTEEGLAREKKVTSALYSLHKKTIRLFEFFSSPLSLDEDLGLVPTIVDERFAVPSSVTITVDKFLRDEAVIPAIRANEEVDFTNVFAGFVDALNLGCSWGPPSLLSLNCYAAGDARQNWLLDVEDFALNKSSSLIFPSNNDQLKAFREVKENKQVDETELALQEAIASILASARQNEENQSYDKDVVVSQFLSDEGDYRSSAVYVESLAAADFFRQARVALAGRALRRIGLEEQGVLLKRLLAFWSSLVRNSAATFKENRAEVPTRLRPVFDDRESPAGFVDALLGVTVGPTSFGTVVHQKETLRGLKDKTPESSIRQLLFADAYGRLFLPFTGEGEADEMLRRAVSDPEIEFTAGKEWIEANEKNLEEGINFLACLNSFADPYDVLSPFSEVAVKQLEAVAVAANTLSDKKTELRRQIQEGDDLEALIANKEARIAAWETPEVLRERFEERKRERQELVQGFVQFWNDRFVSLPQGGLFNNQDFTLTGALSRSTKEVNKSRIESDLAFYWKDELAGSFNWARENFKFEGGFRGQTSPPSSSGEPPRTSTTPSTTESRSTTFTGNSTTGPSFDAQAAGRIGNSLAAQQNRYLANVRELFEKFNQIFRFDGILEFEGAQLERDLVRAEERLPDLADLQQLKIELLEEVELLRLAQAEKARSVAQSQTAIVAHRTLLEAFRAIERNETGTFANIAALSFARWLNVDNQLPQKFGFEAEQSIAGEIEKEIRRGGETRLVNAFERLLLNENYTPDKPFFSAFSGGFVEGTSEVKLVDYLAFELIGPVFETLFERNALDDGKGFNSGTTRWLGLSQPFVWSLVLYILSLEFSYLQTRTNNKLGFNENETNIAFVKEVGTGNQNRIAVRFIPEALYALLTSKQELDYSYVRKVARSQKDFFAHSIQFLELLLQRTKEEVLDFTKYLDEIAEIEVEQDEVEEALDEAQTEVDVLAVAWDKFGSGRASFARQDVVNRLVRTEQLHKRNETKSAEQANRDETFLEKKDTFLLRRKIVSTSTEDPERREGPKDFFNKHENSILIQTLRSLLLETGFGDFLDNDGFIDADRIVALGLQRTNKPWTNSPVSSVAFDWKSLLNESSFSKRFVFDAGLWASPRIENYAYLTLPREEISQTTERIAQDWWDFWIVEEGQVKLLTYEQLRGRLAEESVDPIIVKNLFISEHLKLLVKMLWNLDFRDNVWFDRVVEDVASNEFFAPQAFSRVYLMPWTKDYIRDRGLNTPLYFVQRFQSEFDVEDEELDRSIQTQERLSEVTAGELNVISRDFVYSGLSTFISGDSNE